MLPILSEALTICAATAALLLNYVQYSDHRSKRRERRKQDDDANSVQEAELPAPDKRSSAQQTGSKPAHKGRSDGAQVKL